MTEEKMEKKLHNKRALVTGASRGIGKEIANTLARHGADVVVNYNTSHEDASEIATSVELAGKETWVYPADIRSFQEVEEMKKSIEDNFGTIDILVNNAGINIDKFFTKMEKNDWETVLSVNLDGVFNCSKVFLDDLREAEGGRIINISSVVGQRGNLGQVNYASSKAGMIGFTKALARELVRDEVTVNAVAPGFIATDMVMNIPEKVQESIKKKIPMGRFGETKEVAEAVAFLASPSASYITGEVLKVNGGFYI